MVLVFLPCTQYIFIDLNMDAFGRLMLYARALAMFVPTVICFPICLYNLVFFSKQLRSSNQGSCTFGLILWAIFMWGAKLVHALAQTFVVTAHFELNPDVNHLTHPEIYFAYLFMVRTYCYVVDFLNMASLLYLFYRQGTQAEDWRKVSVVRKNEGLAEEPPTR